MSTVQNQKILYKNETFTLSTYNGFKIITARIPLIKPNI